MTSIITFTYCSKWNQAGSRVRSEILTRFTGTDEGEVIEYRGCDLIRDRSVKTAKIFQKGYAERVLKTFGMSYCKPCATPLDDNGLTLSKEDCPQVVDAALHHRYRNITGCLSYLTSIQSRVCIFPVEQVRTTSGSGTSTSY
jgi:hypothetical protein